MDRGMDRVWVWVCDPSLMFLAVAICGSSNQSTSGSPSLLSLTSQMGRLLMANQVRLHWPTV